MGMESPAAPFEDLTGAPNLGKPSGAPQQPASGVASGGEKPRVSELKLFPGALPEETLDGAAQPGEGIGSVTVEGGNLVLESSSCTSTEVVELVELDSPPEGSDVVNLPGSQEAEKLADGGATGGGDGREAVKKSDGGGGVVPTVVTDPAENPFLVGDLVWGKIKSHPWWPAQVYDASDASEYAKKLRRRDQQCVLVAYLGDRTFAWCDPSQLRPFIEGFDQMARQSVTKNFVGALKEALDEIQRCLELDMACACVPAGALASLSSRRAANAGIREGAIVPKGRAKELSLVDHVPAELLERLHGIACDVSVTGLLEVVAIKGWLSAFNRWMGWHAGLPAEHQEEEGEGLVEGSVKEPAEKRGPSTPSGRRSDAKEKSSHRKKVRSMAELIAETDMDVDMVEDSADVETELASIDKPASTTPGQRKKKGGAKSPDAETVDAGYEEGTGSGRRERKRSKYLSPPYTALIGGRGGGPPPTSPRNGESIQPKKDVETPQGTESASSGSTESKVPTILKCNTEATQDKTAPMSEGGGVSADEMLSEFRTAALNSMYMKGNRSSSKVRVFFDRFRSYSFANVSDYGRNKGPRADGHTEELKTMQPNRVNKPNLNGADVKKGKPLLHEADGSMGGKPGPDMESKTPDISSSASKRKLSAERKKKSGGSDSNVTKGAKSKGKRKSAEQVKPEKKRNKEGEVINGDAGAALLLTFAPGFPLPSKEELISAFSKFGPLCEPETELLKDSGCARVVFARGSDAENLFKSSDRDGALGPGVASCRLQYLHDNNLSMTALPPPGQKPPLNFVQRSLESMISALRESSPHGGLAGPSEELKPEATLVDEMNGLLKKVNKLLAGPAAGTT